MKLDDLKGMDIPKMSPIEIEADAGYIPIRVRKAVGYFRGIEETPPHAKLTYYQSSEDARRLPEKFCYEFLNTISKVNILIIKERN